MKTIPFKLERTIVMARSDAAYLDASDDDTLQALVDAVIHSISIDIEVTAGGVTLHLAAWQDPEHWSEDWNKLGIDDPRGFVEGLVAERAL